ncbi:MAG: 4-(cytidine 5'-diphospho)-2-C-methyl-D-erythritol kinase [bacterium]|nr:4-(cytidine 5'-diphospho)-2-C-methyl-D-erythritol kinase [bacterium]
MDNTVEKAWAKVNLGLKILGRREDGYHDLVSIFQTVDLHDRLTFEPAEGGQIDLICSDQSLPTGEENLIYRAVVLLREETGVDRGVRIHLEKQIPVGAGLGGGSSDAATTLRALNRLWRLHLDARVLHRLAESLGSDVPFFLRPGTALATGRGEQLDYLSWLPQVLYILVYPGFSVSTGWAFQNLKLDLTKDSKYIKFLNSIKKSGQIPTSGLLACLENDFLPLIETTYPQVREVEDRLTDLGASAVSLSGSGSMFFGIFSDRKTALKAHVQLEQDGYEVYCCCPVLD